jgi:PIN domain nuclease of toxin-antitoxin system
MRILVDTHILLWYVAGNPKLDISLREILQDPYNLKMVSIVSLWEIAIKTNIGKLSISYPLDKLVPLDFQLLDIDIIHLLTYQDLPLHHKDPFDRILIAQAMSEELEIMTLDENFPSYDIQLIH